ncbi:MAG: hypothetical protein HUK02_04850, partial [Bacteroidaceae bacterium]|nr:hypothetical protein [Bacteroidaceae bacterium]
TSADCKQLRVTFYLERDAWGSSISDLVADNVKLTGRERKYKQLLGFINSGAEVEYIAYDLTGAYAPVAGSIGDGIDCPQTSVGIRAQHGGVMVTGAQAGQTIAVYDVTGRMLAARKAQGSDEFIPLRHAGVCLVRVGTQSRKVLLH